MSLAMTMTRRMAQVSLGPAGLRSGSLEGEPSRTSSPTQPPPPLQASGITSTSWIWPRATLLP